MFRIRQSAPGAKEADLTDNGLRSAQLIARADEEVYAAKAAGRNCIMQVDEQGRLGDEPLRRA